MQIFRVRAQSWSGCVALTAKIREAPHEKYKSPMLFGCWWCVWRGLAYYICRWELLLSELCSPLSPHATTKPSDSIYTD